MIHQLKMLLFTVCLFAAGSGWSQDYSVLPVNDSFNLEKIKASPEANGDEKKAASILRQKLSKQQQNASQVFRTGEINGQFRAYYTQVVIPELTRYDDQSLMELTENHQKIIKDFRTRIRAQNVLVYLVKDVFFPELSKIVEGNYHPAVRYNAIVTIGKLDEVIGKQRLAAPTPYRESLPFLIAKYNAFNDPKLAYLKYGAFKGIARIAGIEFQKANPTSADAAKPLLVALLGAKPAGLDDELFQSMQKTAVMVLGKLGDPANADAFANLIKDENVSVWTRAEAAMAYSKIKTATVDAAKLEVVANSIAKLMHDVLRQEAKSMKDHQIRTAVLAARKKEVSAEPTAGRPRTGGGGPKKGMGSSRDGNRPNLSSGGSGGGMGAGLGVGGGGLGSGGSGLGSGAPASGGGKTGGTSPTKRNESTELEPLPAYRIQIARRRIKTVALGLFSAFGDPAGLNGMLRWANGNQALLPKLSKLKTHMAEADQAAEIGLSSDSAVVGDVTDALQTELNKVADRIAQSLGLAPAKGDTPVNAGKAKNAKNNSFLNN